MASVALHMELRTHGEPAVLTVEDRALPFRSIRELLQNVARHAGVSSGQGCRATITWPLGE